MGFDQTNVKLYYVFFSDFLLMTLFLTMPIFPNAQHWGSFFTHCMWAYKNEDGITWWNNATGSWSGYLYVMIRAERKICICGSVIDLFTLIIDPVICSAQGLFG